jgi:hypothetical protein
MDIILFCSEVPHYGRINFLGDFCSLYPDMGTFVDLAIIDYLFPILSNSLMISD